MKVFRNVVGLGICAAVTAVAALPASAAESFPNFATSSTTLQSPASPAIGDVTGDNHNDVVTTTYDTGDKLLVISNAGTPAAKSNSYPLHGLELDWDQPRQIRIADLNGDNRKDVAVTGDHGVDILFQKANGRLSKAQLVRRKDVEEIEISDLRNDGTPDVVMRTSAGVFATNGPTFATQVQLSSAFYWEIEIGDISGDGLPDLIGTYFHTTYVSTQTAEGTFSESKKLQLGNKRDILSLALADMNNDGKLDLVISQDNVSRSLLYVVLNNGSGLGKAGTIFTSSQQYVTNIHAMDMNGDGIKDLVGISGDSTVIVNRDSSGNFSAEKIYTPTTSSHLNIEYNLDAGDFNGDGHADIARTFGDDLLLYSSI